jgi:aminoglycoside/choline kinase family phosphotransferase/dTDP-glucose pyrophosphorylase
MRHNKCMNAIILAAGLGTRLRPYTRHTPKALFTINQKPLLAIAITRLIEAGVEKVLINTHCHHRQIETFIGASTFDVPVQLYHEPDILGTGGGIRNLAPEWLPGPVLVVNADIVTDIDLERVCRFHRSHRHAVTMVMHNRAEFNTVGVENGFVKHFTASGQKRSPVRELAFTGIHVLDGRILDFLPDQGPAHIIDAYEGMLAAGEKIRAYRARDHYWQDIGTPGRYIDAAFSQMAPQAFKAAFGAPPRGSIRRHPLHGDGSDRQWYRLIADGRSLIMADHHIRQGRNRQEVDAYVDIGKHLHAKGVAVPQIFLHDNCAGLVFLEDLGDRHLQKAIAGLNLSETKALYEQVIDQWAVMALQGAESFDTAWTAQTPSYNRHVILENECRYFVQAFVRGYLGRDVRFQSLADEFHWLADNIMQITTTGFMHRDLQSRNIMVKGGDIHFIDFQGGRLGPVQYDLASLLIDPYAALSSNLQADLRTYCIDLLKGRYGMDTNDFKGEYTCCALARHLQILGAFAFLGKVKGKTRFFDYIPTAVEGLVSTLAGFEDSALPKLKKLAAAIAARMDRRCPAAK